MKSATYQIPIPWQNEKPCLHRMIRQIQTRPGMYIGSNTLTPLSHFLNGYRAAERDLDVCWHGNLFPLDFTFMHSFTAARLHTGCASAGWCHNMLTFCHGDEEKALNLFFDLYQEFTEVEMKRYWRAILTEENIERNNKMERCYAVREHGPEPIYQDPIAVYVLELTIPSYMLIAETAKEVHAKTPFFSSAEKAKGNSCIPEGAEVYFGKIDAWEEFKANNLYFDKVIKTH